MKQAVKLSVVVAFAIAIGASSVLAETFTWDGGVGNWSDSTWNSGGAAPAVDRIVDDIVINAGTVGYTGYSRMDDNASLTVSGTGVLNKGWSNDGGEWIKGTTELQGGTTTWENNRFHLQGDLNISGGVNTYYSHQYWSLGRQDSGTGHLTISGGTTTIRTDIATVIGGYQGNGLLDMTGGTLSIVGALWIADQGDITINHSGGSIISLNAIMGNNHNNDTTDSYYNLSGTGDLSLTGTLTLGHAGQTPINNVFTMDGGTMSAAGIDHVDGEFVFNGGVLTLDGDVSDTILGETWFIAAAGTTASYDIGTDTTTVIPEPAKLGMIAVFGGGLLFIRRRLLI